MAPTPTAMLAGVETGLIATSSKHFLVFRAKGRDRKVEVAPGPRKGSGWVLLKTENEWLVSPQKLV